MLYRIEPTIFHMRTIIPVVPNVMFPKPPLPNRDLALIRPYAGVHPGIPPGQHRRKRAWRGEPRPTNIPTEPRLDCTPSRRIRHVPLWQCPNGVQMIRHHNPRINPKRMRRPCLAHRIPQHINLTHQQVATALGQCHREEDRRPTDAGAHVNRHGIAMAQHG